VCFSENNRQCSNIRDIDDVAGEQAKQITSSNIIENMRKIQKELYKLVACKSDNVEQIARENNTILQEMDDKVDKLIRKLNELRITFRNEAEQLHSNTKCSLLKNDKNIQCFTTNVMNAYTILDKLEKHRVKNLLHLKTFFHKFCRIINN